LAIVRRRSAVRWVLGSNRSIGDSPDISVFAVSVAVVIVVMSPPFCCRFVLISSCRLWSGEWIPNEIQSPQWWQYSFRGKKNWSII